MIITKNDLGKIKKWVENGGTLIAMGASAAYLADSSSGFSKTRLRRQVLKKIESYEKAFNWEKESKSVKIDSAAIWSGTAKKIAKKEEKKNGTPAKELAERLKNKMQKTINTLCLHPMVHIA